MRFLGVLAAVVGAGSALAGSRLLLSCNSVLGIDPAVLDDGGAADSAADGCVTNYNDLTCDNYCTLIMTNCREQYAEYKSLQMCKQICGGSAFESPGPPLSPSTQPVGANTLGCRIWHANAACLHDPMIHCPHAGPLGGKTCWDNNDSCIPFCLIDTQFCQGAYANNDDCLASCRPDGGPGYVYDTTGVEFSGANTANDTLNCRMYHVENALLATINGEPMNHALHCSHTALDGGGVCVGP